MLTDQTGLGFCSVEGFRVFHFHYCLVAEITEEKGKIKYSIFLFRVSLLYSSQLRLPFKLRLNGVFSPVSYFPTIFLGHQTGALAFFFFK